MNITEALKPFRSFDFDSIWNNTTPKEIDKILQKERLSEMDFLALLSDAADSRLEPMAQKAQAVTIQNFGRVIQIFLPLYISNYCSNVCRYCGFSGNNSIVRTKLSLEEIEANAVEIAKTGIKHILILTGEAPDRTPLSYLTGSVKILKKYFSSISIEIYPMDLKDYKVLRQAGVDGLTVFQEVYDESIYADVHPRGRKSNYLYRLETPDRAAQAGFRSVNIGPLFGLGNPLKEAFSSGIHAAYLTRKYPDTEISISMPRINPAEGNFNSIQPLSDRMMVRVILAFRLFLNRAGITISTRERPDFRDNLIPLGITRMSGGSITSVGGYVKQGEIPQFEISDHRTTTEIIKAIESRGYEAVLKDWEFLA